MENNVEIILAYANVFSRDLIIEESHQRDETMEILPANRISEVTALINRGVSPALIILDAGLSDIKGLAGLTRIIEVTRREVPVAIMGVPTSNSEMRMVLEAGSMAITSVGELLGFENCPAILPNFTTGKPDETVSTNDICKSNLKKSRILFG